MSMLLELEGHRTGTVYNGLEAVQEATRVRYDAVLLDLGMPIMDGFQAAAVLRQLRPSPALIAYSAWDDAETRRRTADLGFSMHLRKPVCFQVLKAALRELPRLRLSTVDRDTQRVGGLVQTFSNRTESCNN
ncbi:response regulator [Caenimonas sp. S4]|nr:response regulator [Caenimonas soli]